MSVRIQSRFVRFAFTQYVTFEPKGTPLMFVYVMQSGDYTKVGISKHPRRRANSLRTANPTDVRIVGMVRTKDAANIEKTAHTMLSNYRARGEWFKLNPYFALTVVEKLAEGEHDDDVVAACIHWPRYENRRDPDGKRIERELVSVLETRWKYRDRILFRL